MNDLSIDFGSAYPYLEDRVLALFGKDAASVEWQSKVRRLVRSSCAESSHVQCIGMAKPIPIQDIYQPTRLLRHDGSSSSSITDIQDLIASGVDAAIFAGPGWGKTTFLHWTYQRYLSADQYTPVLFTLRRQGLCDELTDFVGQLEKGRKVGPPIVLLVDGYDEVDRERQQQVSAALQSFQSLSLGRFFLTCRDHYDIFDLKLEHCRLADFTMEDAARFIDAFSAAYGATIETEKLLNELIDHNLGDFASHPLMLALVCILKTGPNPSIPRRAIGLVRRAIETLTFRWDEAKYIRRESEVPLDGDERVRCLMRIAYDMTSHRASYLQVESSISKHLELVQLRGVHKLALLRELTQWYGLIVPTAEDSWQFVHRTIHDFLAARYWVESGDFHIRTPETWSVRAAYAVCLLPDGTEYVRRILEASKDSLSAFRECLYNNASFQPLPIAEAVVNRTKAIGYTFRQRESVIEVSTNEDFYHLATNEFLLMLIEIGTNRGCNAGTAVAFMSLSELRVRGQRVSRQIIHGACHALTASPRDCRVEAFREQRFSHPDRAIVRFTLDEVISN